MSKNRSMQPTREIISRTEEFFGILYKVIPLSERLKLIFDQLIPDHPVWDLCCDHGYLGLRAYQDERFEAIYFVDQVPEIIERLQLQFKAKHENSKNKTQVHFMALSAEEITQPLTGNVVISGVGSYTVFQILKSLHEKKLLQASRLILCPQNEVIKIEDLKKLPDFSYRQHQEPLIIFEKDRRREVYVLDSNLHT